MADEGCIDLLLAKLCDVRGVGAVPALLQALINMVWGHPPGQHYAAKSPHFANVLGYVTKAAQPRRFAIQLVWAVVRNC